MQMNDLAALQALANAASVPLNIAVVGSTGVGKSSLINAFFGVDRAAIGAGRPVTTEIASYKADGGNVCIYDTRGLEVERSEETTRQLEQLIVGRRNHAAVDEQIHIAWLCISARSNRFEPIHETLAQMFATIHMPFAIVLTQSFGREADELERHIRSLQWIKAPIVQIVAAPKVAGGEVVVEAFGLDRLAAVTAELIGPARAEAADYHRYSAERRTLTTQALQSILDRRTVSEGIATFFAMGGYGLPAMVTANRHIATNICRNIQVCATELGITLSSPVEEYLVDLVATLVRDAAMTKFHARVQSAKDMAEEVLAGDFSTLKAGLLNSLKLSTRGLNPKNTIQDMKDLYKGNSSPGGHRAIQYLRDITFFALSPIIEGRLSNQRVISKPETYRRSLTAILRWVDLGTVIAPELIPVFKSATMAQSPSA